MEWQRAGVGEAEGSEVVDQALEHPGLVDDRAEVRLVGRVHAIEERLEIALDHGERGPQLMAHVGQESTPGRVLRLEAGGHLVESATQATQLAAAPLRLGYPCRIVPRLDAPGGIHEGRQRPPDPARDSDPDDQRHEPDHEDDQCCGSREIGERTLCGQPEQAGEQPQHEDTYRHDQRRHRCDEAAEAAAHSAATTGSPPRRAAPSAAPATSRRHRWRPGLVLRPPRWPPPWRHQLLSASATR